MYVNYHIYHTWILWVWDGGQCDIGYRYVIHGGDGSILHPTKIPTNLQTVKKTENLWGTFIMDQFRCKQIMLTAFQRLKHTYLNYRFSSGSSNPKKDSAFISIQPCFPPVCWIVKTAPSQKINVPGLLLVLPPFLCRFLQICSQTLWVAEDQPYFYDHTLVSTAEHGWDMSHHHSNFLGGNLQFFKHFQT